MNIPLTLTSHASRSTLHFLHPTSYVPRSTVPALHPQRGYFPSAAFLALLLTIAGCQSTSKSVIELTLPPQVEGCPTVAQDVIPPYEKLLQKYVDDAGALDLPGLSADEQARRSLDCFWAYENNLGQQTQTPPDQSQTPAAVADRLNLNNATMLRAVVAAYTAGEAADTSGPVQVRIAAQPLGEWQPDDWRAKFALGNPSKAGPKIANHLFRPENLDDQLDRAVKDYLGSCMGLQIDHARKRVLFGRLIYQQRQQFIDRYRQAHGLEVSLVSALIPYAWPCTQTQLAQAVGYQVAQLEPDEQLHIMKPKKPKTDPDAKQEIDQKPEFPTICGCK